jgi:hypothetical protein
MFPITIIIFITIYISLDNYFFEHLFQIHIHRIKNIYIYTIIQLIHILYINLINLIK